MYIHNLNIYIYIYIYYFYLVHNQFLTSPTNKVTSFLRRTGLPRQFVVDFLRLRTFALNDKTNSYCLDTIKTILPTMAAARDLSGMDISSGEHTSDDSTFNPDDSRYAEQSDDFVLEELPRQSRRKRQGVPVEQPPVPAAKRKRTATRARVASEPNVRQDAGTSRAPTVAQEPDERLVAGTPANVQEHPAQQPVAGASGQQGRIRHPIRRLARPEDALQGSSSSSSGDEIVEGPRPIYANVHASDRYRNPQPDPGEEGDDEDWFGLSDDDVAFGVCSGLEEEDYDSEESKYCFCS